MTDPRIAFMKPAISPVDQPLFGRASRAAGLALHHPAGEPLWGEAARAVGRTLRQS